MSLYLQYTHFSEMHACTIIHSTLFGHCLFSALRRFILGKGVRGLNECGQFVSSFFRDDYRHFMLLHVLVLVSVSHSRFSIPVSLLKQKRNFVIEQVSDRVVVFRCARLLDRSGNEPSAYASRRCLSYVSGQ